MSEFWTIALATAVGLLGLSLIMFIALVLGA